MRLNISPPRFLKYVVIKLLNPIRGENIDLQYVGKQLRLST
jgi:hypothetical protein